MVQLQENAENEEPWVTVPCEVDTLSAATGITKISVPGWRPVGLAEGRRTAYEFAAEGYFVESKALLGAGIILLKVWEFGDPEPTWEEVEAAARPSLSFGFHPTEREQAFCEYAVDAIVSRKLMSEELAVRFVDDNQQAIPLPRHPTTTDDDLSKWVRQMADAASVQSTARAGLPKPAGFSSSQMRRWFRLSRNPSSKPDP